MKSDIKWTIFTTLPYDSYLSKNRSIKINKQGLIYKDPKHKKIQEDIYWILKGLTHKNGYSKCPTDGHKILLKIHFYKPRVNCDAVNILYGLCDAIKKAIDVDDKWFSIHGLDWSIDKKNPRIDLMIGYDIKEVNINGKI